MIASGKIRTIVSKAASRKIACGVLIGHLLILIVFPAIAILWGWIFKEEKIETIQIQLYDPEQDNIVDNASPDPDPSNPIPPSGNPDAGEPEPEPEPEDEPVEEQPQPEPEPTPVVNHTLPQQKPQVQPVKTIKQPKVKPRKRPKPKPNPQPKPQPKPKPKPAPKPSSDPGSKPSQRRTPGQRGSNSQPGNNRPGGQRGNTAAYQAKVARQVRMMWVTPDKMRLGDRNPSVLIEITIDRRGRVTNKRIVRTSGVMAMDESVAELLKALNWFDPPDDGESHTFQFNMTADQ